jgi:DNA (cytosine-5)-methyltransferase 1
LRVGLDREASLKSTSTAARTALSLFSGAGGLDLGLELAGWTILGQVEMDHDAAETLRRRAGKDGVVIEERIENVDPVKLRRQLGLKVGELALIAGGPPCQPFTTSGLRKSIQDRRASSLFPRYLSFLDAFKPRALLIENVDGMLSAALRHRPLHLRGSANGPMGLDEMKGSFLRWLLGELAERGYSLSWGVAEAADYGVPQFRQRAIVIGVLGGTPCYLPPPRFGRPGLEPYRTVGEALAEVTELGAIQPLSERKRAVYAQVPAGGNWRDLPDDVRRSTMGAAYVAEGGKSGWWRRLAWESPAPTILGMPDHSSTALVHPIDVRCLSVNECAALQSFPLGTSFAGSGRSQYQQIGNAVPPLLGEALGRHLSAFLSGAACPIPEEPQWRRLSANRRVGTHGWATPSKRGPDFTLSVRVRPDHIWAHLMDEDVA